MAQVNEGSTAYLTIACKNKAGANEAPASLTYTIADATSGAAVRESTSLTPSGEVEIALSPDDNAIIDPTRGRETRLVTVVATYGLNDAVKASFMYDVINLGGVSSA